MKQRKAIGFEFNRVSKIIKRNLHARLAAAGFDEVTVMHGWIMGFLYSHADEELCQKDLEEKFGIARSTVTNILKLMEKKGYITRTMDERDTRKKCIKLTPEGVRVHLETVKVIDKMHEEMERDISEQERESFFYIVDKLLNNIEEAY